MKISQRMTIMVDCCQVRFQSQQSTLLNYLRYRQAVVVWSTPPTMKQFIFGSTGFLRSLENYGKKIFIFQSGKN